MQKSVFIQPYEADALIMVRFTDILRKNYERINLYLSICSSQLHFGMFEIIMGIFTKSSPLLSC